MKGVYLNYLKNVAGLVHMQAVVVIKPMAEEAP